MPWQPAPILFPDVELVVTGALRALLAAAGQADVYVSRSIPNPRRARMVVVNRDGGPSATLDRPRLRVRAWDSSPQAANDLARLVVALMQRLPNATPDVLSVEHLSGPYDVPDDSGQEQRYLLFQLTTRGSDLP